MRCRGRASWGAGTGGRRPIGFQVAEPPASSKKEEKRIRRGFSPLPIHDDFSFFFFLEIIQVVSFERFFGFKSLIALLKAKN